MVHRKLIAQFLENDSEHTRVFACISHERAGWVEVRHGDQCHEYTPVRARVVGHAIIDAADCAEAMH